MAAHFRRTLLRTFDKGWSVHRTQKNVSGMMVTRLFSEHARTKINLKSGDVWKVAGLCAASLSSVFVYKLWSNTVSAKAQHPVSRSIQGTVSLSNLKFTLYQFQSCPYCCKVRATLDYYGFPYDVVEVNSLTKAQLGFSAYKKVPVLVVDGTNFGDEYQLILDVNGPLFNYKLSICYVNYRSLTVFCNESLAAMLRLRQESFGSEKQFFDSSLIVSVLGSFVYDQTQTIRHLHRFYPGYKEKKGRKTVWEFPNKYFVMYAENITDKRTEKERKEERKWRRWTDDTFMHTISPNVYRTLKESFEAFKHFSDWGEWENNFSWLTCFCLVNLGAVAMYMVGGIVKRRHNISNDPRESLYEACDAWMKNLGNRQYLGGDSPNLADLSMYGAMNSFNNCTAFNEVMDTHPIKQWFLRMDQGVTTHKGSERFQEETS